MLNVIYTTEKYTHLKTKVNSNEESLFKYFSGKATNNEIRFISEWLDQDKHNIHEFATLKKIFVEISANLDYDKSVVEKAYNVFLERADAYEKNKGPDKKSKINRLRKSIVKYAAAIVLMISIGTGAYFLGGKTIFLLDRESCEIVVPYGSRSSVVLPDGSKIWLNAGSKLIYNRQFGIRERKVFLEGEAYFTIEKKKHPFVVHTSHLDIHVLGTAFNVKSYPEEDNIETTLVKGNIRIETKKSDSPVYLKPKQKLTFYKANAFTEISSFEKKSKSSKTGNKNLTSSPDRKSSGDIDIKINVNTEEFTSWKDGKLIFNNEPLESLAKKLERKYNIIFIFKDEELKKYSYSGTLLDFPLEQVLKALELTSPINYTIHEKKVTLYYNKNF